MTYRNWLQISAALWLLLLSPLATARDSVLIIKSGDNHYFSTSIEQIINHVPGHGFNIITLGSPQEQPQISYQPGLIITLGAAAASYSRYFGNDIPVIHSYISSFQQQHTEQHQNHYTLLLEQPLMRYVNFVQLLLAPQSIAIVEPEQNKISQDRIRNLQERFGLSINQGLFRDGDNPVKTVRSLLEQSDVLLSLPAPRIYNRKSLKGILLSSYRQQKPVVSYSPSHVKYGALASIYTTPADIGRQIARLANQILQARPPAQREFYAADFNILVNQRVARSLGIDLPETGDIVRQLNQAAQL